MRRWRRKKDEDDEPLTFDDVEGDEDEEDVPRRRYIRPIRFTMFDRDEEDSGPKFEELESKIRAGEYKPKRTDPYTAHVLYNNLVDLGVIKAIL